MAAASIIQNISTRAAIVLLGVALAACGGDPDSPQPPQTGGGGGGGGGGNGNDKPTATVMMDSPHGARQLVVVEFSEAMREDSLELGGTLVGEAEITWVDADTLELHPRTYWPVGTQSLEIDAADSEGAAMDTLTQDVEVASAFRTDQAATLVIGQQDFNNGQPRQDINAMSAGPNTLDTPSAAVDYSAEKDILFISDTFDSRVLGFFGIPETNNANADFVIGQDSFHSSHGETSADKMRRAQGLSAQSGHLLVGDPDSHRILVYPDVPEAGPGQPVAVLGQTDFEAFNNACAPNRFNHSHHQFVTPSGRLLVADAANNRVLLWNEIPAETGSTPDMVLGQSRLDICAANDDDQNGYSAEGTLPTERTLNHPVGIWSDDERLVVADNYNQRVLIWNTFPEENFAPADVVLGQADMNSVTPNDDNNDGEPDAAPTARTVDYPWSVWVEKGQLFLADQHNHRVLVWDELPQESFTPADHVIGQASFEENLPNRGAENPTAQTLQNPMGVRVIHDQLFVTDSNNSRVLVYDAE